MFSFVFGVASSRVTCVLPRRFISYVGRPTPSIEKADVVGLLQTHARRTTLGSRDLGPRLRPTEFAALGRARRTGVLVCGAGARSQSLVDRHLKFCWATARAFFAVDVHGTTVTVDVRPLAGLGRKDPLVAAGAAAVARARTELLPAALTKAQEAERCVFQISNPSTLKADLAKLLPSPREGSNEGRTPDSAPGDFFTLYSPSRTSALAAAAAMHAELTSAFGWRTSEDYVDAKAAGDEVRMRRYRARMLRRLAELAADSDKAKNLRVPSGAIAGYETAVKLGLIDEKTK